MSVISKDVPSKQRLNDTSSESEVAMQSTQGGDGDAPELAIHIDNLNSWYGDFQALHSITLAVPKYKVTSFIGPSGCGKSTLLRWFNRMNDTILSAKATGKLMMGEL